jgi:hypothetical protein
MTARRKPEHRMHAATRVTARIIAQELIAELYTQREVERRLMKRYRCSNNVASEIYREAFRELKEADDGDRENRMARMNAQIGVLYRDARKDKRYSVCRQLLADVRRMQGIEGSLKIDLPLTADGDPISTRSDAELEYFKTNGYWPEEAPRSTATPAAKGKPSSNPLDRLVH